MKYIIPFMLILPLLSCKEEASPVAQNSIETQKATDRQPEPEEVKIEEIKPQRIEDKFVGRWRNIEGDREIITVKKLHDYQYSIGELNFNKGYALDGAEYLQGLMDGVEIQVIYDNHTGHIIIRNPVSAFEYEKI
jgi:hypothetical protein